MMSEHHPANYWHKTEDGRIQCDVCPRDCKLHDGQRGACFVRKREADEMVLTTYGRSSGFCIDPIEKKPLNHFYPGSSLPYSCSWAFWWLRALAGLGGVNRASAGVAAISTREVKRLAVVIDGVGKLGGTAACSMSAQV
jgi:hypothetical protein